jgi:glycosyltransferase involved in cell wall biosynthesis
MAAELFIGITSWNSSLFLPHCLKAIREKTRGVTIDLVVLDNCSDDNSAEIARHWDATIFQKRCSQGDALNRLIALSSAPYTLLIHADVILLSRNWFDICRAQVNNSVALVSPEDIGCGPLTRPFGHGKPESSFMFFNTSAFKDLRKTRWTRRWGLPVPRRVVDFYGAHVTHNLPERLKMVGLGWFPMAVHWSDRVKEPIFKPTYKPQVWSDELSFLRYGLGNFYSVDNIVTHYHNWYDRISGNSNNKAGGASRINRSFPPEYIRTYTRAFLSDLESGSVVIPAPVVQLRKPVAL